MIRAVFSAGFLALAGVALLGGCTSAGVPVDRVQASQAAINADEAASLTDSQPAANHLRRASLERAEAEDLSRHGHRHRAARAFQRAEADADLASVLARESSEARATQRARAQVGGGPPPTAP